MSPALTSARCALCTCSTAVRSTLAERGRLFGLALPAAAHLFERGVEVLVELFAKLRQIGAAGRQDPLAFLVVRQGVQQVLERQIGVPARHRFAVGNGQDDFERGGEHSRALC